MVVATAIPEYGTLKHISCLRNTMSDCEECFVTCQVKRLMNRLSQIGIGGTGTIRSNRLQGCNLANLSKCSRGAYDYAYDSSTQT